MSDSTRRGFLKVAGVGVAAAGAAAVVPAAIHHADSGSRDVALPAQAKGSLMAYVSDMRSGEVSVMVEGHEVVVTDHQLVARLAHALHSAPSAAQA